MDTGTIIGIVAIFVTIILFIIPLWKKKKEAKEQKKQQLDTKFKDNLGGIYIPMNVTDMQSGSKSFPFFEHFAKIIQKRPIKSRYICLLGDIGSGKTTTLSHLHQWYIDECSSKSSMPSNIKLYTLNKGYQEFLDRIKEEIPLKDRSNCILLLDALDECVEARDSLKNTPNNNPRVFMEGLARDTDSFEWVVVSCRRQFFQSEEFQPGKATVPTGERGFDSLPYWQELILEPFNDKQVENFLVKHFGVGENPQKNEAIKMVYGCKDVFLRPLILSNIDIILKECHDQENLTMKVILDVVIMNWIRREAQGDEAKTKELLNVSLCTAAYMYKHKLIYLNDADYKVMCKEHGIDDHRNLLRVQSLLINDAKEGFRFAHQSFYEHLLAYWFFLHPDDIGSLQGLLESTLPAYIEILNEDNEKATEMSRLLDIDKVDDYRIAAGQYNIGTGLYKLNHFSKAEPFYERALEISRKMEKNLPGEFIIHVAMTLNNLAILHDKTNRDDKALKEYQEALGIYREQVEKNPDAYLPNVAMMMNNLAILHYKTNRYDEAEKEYQEALETYHKLAEKNPNAYLSGVAMMLNNLANLHSDTKRNDEAEEEYNESLRIRRKLEERYSDAYLPDIAETLNNLASLHCKSNRYDEAEKEYQEALKTHQKLAEKHFDAYLPNVAMTMNIIALLHYKTNQYDEAEKEYQEALKIRRELAEKNPNAYLPDVATTLYNMALLHVAKGELADAEEKVKEILESYQQMDAKSRAAFDEYVEKGKQLLADIQKAQEAGD